MSSKMANKIYNKFNSKKNLFILSPKNNSSKLLDKQFLFTRTRDFFEEKKNRKIETLPYINKKEKIISSQKILTTENNNYTSRFFSPKNLQTKKKIKIFSLDKESKINVESTITKNFHKNHLYLQKPNSKLKLINKKNKSSIKFPLVNLNNFPILEKKNNDQLKTQNKKLSPINKPQNFTESPQNDKNFYIESKTGTEEDGKIKENNQDSIIVIEKVCDIENYNIIAVMDGHGTNGHLVSNFVKNKINEYFNNKKLYKSKLFKKNQNISPSEKLELQQKIIYEKLTYNNYELIKNFYQKVSDELYESVFDIHFSGTTCTIIFKLQNKIICSNVGDSRAILYKKNNFISLSNDHKPNLPKEKKRILDMGGEVYSTYIEEDKNNFPDVFRVWKKGCDYPGIAISRSLGDKVAELIGVTYEPEILEFSLDDCCEFIVCASDGIWEYLSNEEVGEIVRKYLETKNGNMACFELIEKATKLFKEYEERVDDISICVYFL